LVESGDRWCCNCGAGCTVNISGNPMSIPVTLQTVPATSPGGCVGCVGSSVCSSQTADERRTQCGIECSGWALQAARRQFGSGVKFTDLTCNDAKQDDSTFCKGGCNTGGPG
jgi:hypothetical protein